MDRSRRRAEPTGQRGVRRGRGERRPAGRARSTLIRRSQACRRTAPSCSSSRLPLRACTTWRPASPLSSLGWRASVQAGPQGAAPCRWARRTSPSADGPTLPTGANRGRWIGPTASCGSPATATSPRAGRASSRRTRARGSDAATASLVGDPDKVGTGYGLEEQQVTRLRLVQSGDQPGHHTGRPSPADDQIGPACTWPYRAVWLSRRLQGSSHSRPDRDHASTGSTSVIDEAGRGLRHREPLRRWRFMLLRRRQPGVQGERREHDAALDQLGDHPIGERPARRRHLGTARLVGVHRLHVGKRPATVQIVVANRLSVIGQVLDAVDPSARQGAPQPTLAAHLRRGTTQRPASGCRQRGRSPRRRRTSRAGPELSRIRSSINQLPSSSSPATCIRLSRWCSRQTWSAAGTVRDVFTTTRSPGSR